VCHNDMPVDMFSFVKGWIMRRRISRVLMVAAGVLVAAPLAVAVQALPANAATGKLLVTTLGHTGVARSSQVMALNIGQDTQYQGNTGRAFSVPDGQYALIAGIDDNNTVETMAEAIVSVRGTATTRVTLDGRKGRLVKVTLDGKRVTDNIFVSVCAGPTAMAFVDGFQPGGALYVLPSSSHVFSSAFTAVGPGVELAGQAAGVPASLGGAWRSSQLAKVTSAVRSGEQNDASGTGYQIQMEPPPGSSNPCASFTEALVSGPAPYRVTERVSPGYWEVDTNDPVGGYFLQGKHFASGHAYSFTLYAAAWAPFGEVADLRPSAIMFGVPMFADPAGNGFEASDKETVALSVNGHLLAKRQLTSWRNGVQDFYVPSGTSGWYTLTDDEYRYHPGLSLTGVLSPHVTFAWHFYAVPSTVGTNFRLTDGFWPTFQPLGLSLRNSAARGSKTTVLIKLSRRSGDTTNIPVDSVTRVRAWFSFDGKHWSAVSVRHVRAGWTAVVANTVQGTVSLRVLANGSHGDTSQETIYKAYAVG
jgi:hypothetical protein